MACNLYNAHRPELVGDPVDVTTGANTDISGEFRLSGPLPFVWQRYYNSSLHRWRRALGWGHTHEYDHRLQFDVDGLRYTGPAGQQVEFEAPQYNGETVINGGCRLTRISAQIYRLDGLLPGRQLMFAFRTGTLPAHLTEITNGEHSFRFLYTERGHLQGVALSAGKHITVQTDEHSQVRALWLSDPGISEAKLLIGYQYDAAGNLISGIDAYRNTFSFCYDQQNRMVSRTDRRGYSFLFDYDGEGRCIRSAGEDGVQQIELRYLMQERVTVVTQADGGEWIYFYNESGQVTQIIDPLGGVRRFEIDEDGLVRAETDPSGNITQYILDPSGEATARVSPIGIRYRIDEPPPPRFRPHRIPENPAQYEYGDLLTHWLAPTGANTADRRLAPALLRLLTDPLPAEHRAIASDPFGNLLRQPAASGALRRWSYDPNGNLARYHDFSGAAYTLEYASWNHLVRVVNPLGHVVRSEFTKSEQLASITDGGGTEQRYSYDLLGNVVSVHRHGQLLETYEYDSAGNLVTKRDASGNMLLTLKIVPRNLLGTRRLASGDVQQFEYDNAGRYLRATSQSADIRFAYNQRGQRVKEQRGDRSVEHKYEQGRLAETAVLGRFVTRYYHASNSLLLRDSTGASHRITLPYRNVVLREFAHGTAEYTRFDQFGNVQARVAFRSQNGSRPWTRQYEWSPDGDLLRCQDTQSGSVAWQYDAAHRLREMTLPDGSHQAFQYDSGGNLLKGPGLAGVSLIPGNRLSTANGDSFEYNDRDHVARRHGPKGATVYHYDSRDMLVCVEGRTGLWDAAYDALGRRVSKTFDGQTTEYLWDTDRLAAEIDPSGRVRVYVYADSLALTPLLFIDYESVDADPRSGTRYFLFGNQLGAPVVIEDETSRIAWRCTYTPYGAARIDPISVIACNLRFPGHYFDSETGLHYNRFRYYSPELGRYLQCDPEGIIGGLNLYAYTRNPLIEVDLRGLSCEEHRGASKEQIEACEDCRNHDAAVRRENNLAPSEKESTYHPDNVRRRQSEMEKHLKERYGDNAVERVEPVTTEKSGPIGPLRGEEAAKAAAALGYDQRVKDPPFHSHGQPVFTNGKDYITPDVDGHRAYGWKRFDRRGYREGTYTRDLSKKVGK